MEIQKLGWRDINIFDMVKNSVSQRKDEAINSHMSFEDQPAVDVFISEEGYGALRDKLKQSGLESKTDWQNNIETLIEQAKVEDGSKELQVIWDLCNEIGKAASSENCGKSTRGELPDLMESAMSAYEKLYNGLIEKHKNGDRWLEYGGITKCMTLEADLDALDEAYKLYTGRIEAVARIQQTNKHFEQEYYRSQYSGQRIRKHSLSEIQTPGNSQFQDNGYHYLDEDYINTISSIMEEGRRKFLGLLKTPQYKQGMSAGIVSGLINGNKDFLEKTKKLFSK